MLDNKVFVYWNLHKKCWSLRSCRTRKVVKHLENLVLVYCRFKVSERGRQRVIRERVKNVHAGVEGFLFTGTTPEVMQDARVRYDPYTQEKFTVNGAPIDKADVVVFKSDRSVFIAS